jgi:hypothetical protein
MEPIVPVISHAAVGPLGVAHLPRLWLKLILHAKGRLPEGFRHGTGGMDEQVLRGLGIDPPAFYAYVESELPTYLECEQWVRAHATKLDAESLAKVNAELTGRVKTASSAKAQRLFIGLDDDGPAPTVLMNDLDDWTLLHGLVTRGVLPPLISSALNGALSELLKELLDATHASQCAISIDLPQVGLTPERPHVQVKRDGAEAFDDASAARTTETVSVNGKAVAWISMEDAGPGQWTPSDVAALQDTGRRAARMLDTVARGGI